MMEGSTEPTRYLEILTSLKLSKYEFEFKRL
jgi:hypothetical protein